MSKLIQTLPPPPQPTLQDVINKLPVDVRRALSVQLGFCRNKLDLKFLMDWYNHQDIWREPKVSFDTFIDDVRYLGIGTSVYPAIRKMAKQILHNNYSEAVVVGGIGSGKSTQSQLIAAYQTHHLMCLRDPHRYYKLTKDKPITIMNMGTTATQALEVTFAGIKSFIEKSRWFKQFSPNILSGSIRFHQNNILLVSGNSKATTPLGYNVFTAIMDEAAFYLDNDNKQMAEEIYTALQRRIVSRFGYNGLLMMISSPKYEGDFIMRKLAEAHKYPNIVYAKQLPTWKCKPLIQQDLTSKFYFNTRTCLVDSNPIGNISKLEDPWDKTAEFWEIPGEYKKSFIQDPEKAKRDFAALPSQTIESFMPHPQIIQGMFTSDPSPVQPNGSYIFKDKPLRVNYYVHIDLALNRNKKGDHAGFSMAHFDGWEDNPLTGERQKKVVVDLAEQIGAGPTGEIQFEDVRNRVYALRKMGYNIVLTTLDQFQSADTLQQFRSKNIRADYLSVDRTIEPYNTLKALINSGRIKCHQMDVLFDELRQLEITKAGKVDHSPSSSKDVSDAVCGAVYNVIENEGADVGVAAGDYFKPVEPGSAEYWKQKEEHYKMLHKLQSEGVL